MPTYFTNNWLTTTTPTTTSLRSSSSPSLHSKQQLIHNPNFWLKPKTSIPFATIKSVAVFVVWMPRLYLAIYLCAINDMLQHRHHHHFFCLRPPFPCVNISNKGKKWDANFLWRQIADEAKKSNALQKYVQVFFSMARKNKLQKSKRKDDKCHECQRRQRHYHYPAIYLLSLLLFSVSTSSSLALVLLSQQQRNSQDMMNVCDYDCALGSVAVLVHCCCTLHFLPWHRCGGVQHKQALCHLLYDFIAYFHFVFPFCTSRQRNTTMKTFTFLFHQKQGAGKEDKWNGRHCPKKS